MDSSEEEKIEKKVKKNTRQTQISIKAIHKNNIIIGEINIKKEDINKDIQIINSFENVKRKWKMEDRDDDDNEDEDEEENNNKKGGNNF